MFAENHAEFFDKATGFGEDIRIGNVDGLGIFDLESQDVLGNIGSAQPSALVATADFPYATVGDTATIRNVAYTVAGLYPDGTGMTRVALKT